MSKAKTTKKVRFIYSHVQQNDLNCPSDIVHTHSAEISMAI